MTYGESSEVQWREREKLQELFAGRSIQFVDKEKGNITLSDGTVLRLEANQGCGGCTSGWYEIEKLSTVDHIITSVRVTETTFMARLKDWKGKFYREERQRYTLFVFAGDKRLNAATVVGDDGNGYYGTGFTVRVISGAK